ncbi:MAG: outer membrane beta-barrel protein [candidate division Zixibacteria bacterium]|nr:outer membrane beta-barrel protein [candidate division Zixibacteria bacterium]
MKRITLLTVAVFALLIIYAPAEAIDQTGKIGFGVNGGLTIPVAGDLSGDSTIADYFGLGPAFGVHVKYGVMKEVSLEAGFRYTFLKIKDDANTFLPDEPNIVAPEIYLDGIVNFGPFFRNPNNSINPFVKAGVGLIPWKYTEDGAGGDAIVLGNDEEFKKTSLGMNFGGGLEVFATPDLSIFAEGRYLMVFSEDEDKFGADFGNMGNVNISVGLTYYLPVSSR